MRVPIVAAWVLWVAAALFLGYAELRGDDAGVLAGLIVLTGFALACLDPHHPWKWGLLTGLAIPASDALFRRPPASLDPGLLEVSAFAIAMALVGSHTGAFVRHSIAPRGHFGR